jgi:flavin reductase (DIM6/NTAB) family NADH-FMN oxidoreductase RutF
MDVKRKIHQALRKLLLGGTDLPQACDISLDHPQTEISVRLLGMGLDLDVTNSHSVACAVPFMFCIGLEHSELHKLVTGSYFTLEFRENRGRGKVLGVIKLKLQTNLLVECHWVGLFKAVECQNYCIPRYRLHAHQFLLRYYQRKNGRRAGEMQVSTLDTQCNAVTFICPRPVVLVCVVDGFRGNVFPMNLLGDLGGNYFAFALNGERQAAPLVERLGRLTLSTVPLSKSPIVRELGKNHYLNPIPLEEVPFALQQSGGLDIPFPEFAIRVRELQVLEVRSLGSHNFFLAKTTRETINMSGQEFHMIHGFYAARRGHY